MSTNRLWYYRGMNEEVFSFEDRDYVNPTLSRDEQLSFIDNFRDIEQQNINQINADTYALGTQVPSNLGGLTGSEGIWNARYRTPKTETTIANLQAAAQQSALNQAMTNLQNMWQNRYNQAYRRARAKAYNDSLKAAQQAAKPTYTASDTIGQGISATNAPGTSVVLTPNGQGIGVYNTADAMTNNGAKPLITQYEQEAAPAKTSNLDQQINGSLALAGLSSPFLGPALLTGSLLSNLFLGNKNGN